MEEHCCTQGRNPCKNTWLALRAQKPLLAPFSSPFSSCSSVQSCLFRAQSHILQMLCRKKPLTPLKLYKSQGMLITQSEPIIPAQAPQSMGFADSPPLAFCTTNSANILPLTIFRMHHKIRLQPCGFLGFPGFGISHPQSCFAEIGNLFDTEQAGSSQPF